MKDRLTAPDAEYALLARLIIEPDAIPEVLGRIVPADFAVADHGRVYALIAERYEAEQPVDAVIVKSATGVEFDPLNLPKGATGPITGYIETITDASTRRAVVDVLDRARNRIISKDDEPISVVESAIDDLVARNVSSGMRSADQIIDDYGDIVRKREGAKQGLTYGIEGLDNLLLPARGGRLIMIAARPGVGKTAMAETIADHWARTAGPVLFASLEMDAEELLDRAVARDSGIPVTPIMRGEVKYEELAPHIEQRRQVPIIYDEKATTMPAIKASAARVKLANGGKLAGVVIDYIQLLADKEGGDNEVYRVANISHAAKRMARALKCPVLALVQFSRSIEQGEKPRKPRLSDMRDSGALEQDADVVIALIGDPERSLREAHVLKQRQGKLGVATMYFHGEVQRWSDKQEDLEW